MLSGSFRMSECKRFVFRLDMLDRAERVERVERVPSLGFRV